MSFSKAKLKRFNEISVTDSPYSDRTERKDSIKKLMKELSQNAEPKKSSSTKEAAIVVASDTESVKSSQTESTSKNSFRLFRTPSLPRRLRFNRQHSDLTPKTAKKLFQPIPTLPTDNSNKEREALEAANVEILNKTQVLLEYEQNIDELKQKLHVSQSLSRQANEEIQAQEKRINELAEENKDNNGAIRLLKEISEKSIAKVEILEGEIKMILRNHENEIDFLIRTNADIELNCERSKMENRLLNDEIVSLKNELLVNNNANRTMQHNFNENQLKLNEYEMDCKRMSEETRRLLLEIENIKSQADADMLAYVEESKNMLTQLDALKREKLKICSELQLRDDMMKELMDELAGKEIEADTIRDEQREIFNAELNATTKKYEQQIATINELHAMKIKEMDSIFVLEKSKIVKEHSDLVFSMTSEMERGNDTVEEKIRISEIQGEQQLKAMEATLAQSIDQEKRIWKSEMDKCQKIAEAEIMQSEFEKQDLKTLLDAANELMKEKDDQIEALQSRLKSEIDEFNKMRENFENDLSDTRMECARITNEKYTYQLTLNNTRSTVTILMDRLKRSDSDVELLKNDLEMANAAKLEADQKLFQINEELAELYKEAEDYRKALSTLRSSSLALEREVKEKESVFEKLMTSEEETLETVNKIGKLFNDKLEENIGKYFDMYNEMKLKYEARENYIVDMKSLLDEFANGIELARRELDSKDEKLFELQQENKSIKLENMTYKFKCEQFEKYDHERGPHPSPELVMNGDTGCGSGGMEKLCTEDDNGMVSQSLIATIINQLEKDAAIESHDFINTGLYSDEDKISAENNLLKEKLNEKTRQIEILQDMVKLESLHAVENEQLKKRLDEIKENMNRTIKSTTPNKHIEAVAKNSNRKKIDHLKESNLLLKNKIAHLQVVNKEQESKIIELKENQIGNDRTPSRKLNVSLGTPKTPKTPKSLFPGKENHPTELQCVSPNVFKNRKN